MANPSEKFALFSALLNGSPFGMMSGGAMPLKQKGGSKKLPPFSHEPADLSKVPEATTSFNQRLDPMAREELLKAMIARSLANANKPRDMTGGGNGA